MQSFHYLFGDQGVFVAGAVVDDEIDLSPVLYGLIYDLCRFLNHLLIQHTREQFTEDESCGLPLQRVFPIPINCLDSS